MGRKKNICLRLVDSGTELIRFGETVKILGFSFQYSIISSSTVTANSGYYIPAIYNGADGTIYTAGSYVATPYNITDLSVVDYGNQFVGIISPVLGTSTFSGSAGMGDISNAINQMAITSGSFIANEFETNEIRLGTVNASGTPVTLPNDVVVNITYETL